MRLPKRKRNLLFVELLIALFIIITGDTSITHLLPKEIQEAILTPTPTLENVKGSKDAQPFPPDSQNPLRVLAKVIKVIDGDTIELEGGIKLRYIGINTPETVDPRRGVQCFGKEASARNKSLVEGMTVGLEKDISEIDRYGRILRYVYVGNIMINEQLVREGYASATAYPPDVKHQNILERAEEQAKAERLGLWSNCPIEQNILL